jgi:excisionase family DNA binding protein
MRRLTLNETARFLGISTPTARGMARRGELPGGVRLGRRVTYRPEDLRRFVANGGTLATEVTKSAPLSAT